MSRASPEESTPRAAHRPSRRQVVVDVAMELFATQPPDLVTVADIAAQAGMTSAAVYYHSPTKDAILLEGMRTFADVLETELGLLVEAMSTGDSMGELLTGLLTWLDEHDPSATVFFVSSVGVDEEMEKLRRETRYRLIELFAVGTRQARGKDAVGERSGLIDEGLAVLGAGSAMGRPLAQGAPYIFRTHSRRSPRILACLVRATIPPGSTVCAGRHPSEAPWCSVSITTSRPWASPYSAISSAAAHNSGRGVP